MWFSIPPIIMASFSVRSFSHTHNTSHDCGLHLDDHSWEVVERKHAARGEDAAAAAHVDIGDESVYSLLTEGPVARASSTVASSPDWTMLASIGSMFPDDAGSGITPRDHHKTSPSGTTEAQEQAPLEKETLVHLWRRMEAGRGRCRALFPEPLAIPADTQRWTAQVEALQRQRERQADAESLRVLEFWTARQERDRRLGGRSDAASLKRLEYWTERPKTLADVQ